MKTIFTFYYLLFTFSFANAQQFDWVKGGGTPDQTANVSGTEEYTRFMTTDPNGNVYALTNLGVGTITADTFYRATGAYGSNQNLFLASYAPSGRMRWAKLIASTGGPCYLYDVVADSIGHIYVAGFFFNDILHIGYDDTVGISHAYDNTGLIQFDTSGVFNWAQFVGNNTTATSSSEAGPNTLVIDGNNNVHYIDYMKSGAPLMAGVTSQYGTYDLVYNPAGTLLSATRLNLDSVWNIGDAVIDPVSNKLFVCGIRNQAIVPTGACFAAAFDTSRNVLWLDTLKKTYSALQSVVYDHMGHLYFNGSGQDTFSFNGISNIGGGTSDILKTDTNGHPIWLQYNQICCNGTNGYAPNTLTLLPNNLIASAGIYGTSITDGIHTIAIPGGVGENPFLSVLDTSGVPMSLQQVYGDGFYDWGTSITSDRTGNVYIGGMVQDSIYATNPSGNIPAYHSVGGFSDYFVMRYGIDSNCTAMPVADYTVTGTDTAHTRNFTYTGTTTNIDSTVWSMYDTTVFAHGSTATKTFDTGSYEVCVTVYTPCGQDMHCSRIVVTPVSHVGVNIITADGIAVYPNPATDELNIKTQVQGYSYRLLTITGAAIQSGILLQGNNQVSLSNIAPGMYLLELKDINGQLSMVKFVKE